MLEDEPARVPGSGQVAGPGVSVLCPSFSG